MDLDSLAARIRQHMDRTAPLLNQLENAAPLFERLNAAFPALERLVELLPEIEELFAPHEEKSPAADPQEAADDGTHHEPAVS